MDKYQAQMIARVIAAIITPIIIGLVFRFIYKRNAKIAEQNIGKDKVVLRMTKVALWVGSVLGVLMTIGTIGLIGQSTPKNWITNLLLPLPLWALALFLIIPYFTWRIELYSSADYFIYRSSFGIRHVIPYAEVRYFKDGSQSIEVYTKKRHFGVGYEVENFSIFLTELSKREIKEHCTLNTEHQVFRYHPAWTAVGIGGILLSGMITVMIHISFTNAPYSKTTENIVGFSIIIFCMFAPSVYITLTTLTWKLQTFRSKDYFLYRSFFGKTHQIAYKDVISFKVRASLFTLQTADKKFYGFSNLMPTTFPVIEENFKQHRVKLKYLPSNLRLP